MVATGCPGRRRSSAIPRMRPRLAGAELAPGAACRRGTAAHRGGQEKEVWIRLSESARAPGLQVVHRRSPRAREFGPYLGGLQVRRAVSGLSRVLPLAYAGGELSGTRHEMARVLGVTPAERNELRRRRWRRPSTATRPRSRWCAMRLSARRDEAAAALAFEFAARLQQEIAGPRLGNRRAEGHQARAGRLRRVRVGRRHAGPFHDPRRAAVRAGPRTAATPPPPAVTWAEPRPSGPDSPSATPSCAARLAADGGARSAESVNDQSHSNERTRGSSLR